MEKLRKTMERNRECDVKRKKNTKRQRALISVYNKSFQKECASNGFNIGGWETSP